MNESDYNQLREQAWRRKLTAAEDASARAWLAAHPESRADWEIEGGLTQALGRLPDAPVPGNFTARVLQAVERETIAASRPKAFRPWFLRMLAPRLAVPAVVLGVGLLTYHEHTIANIAKRAELVRGVKVVAGVSSLPGPDILQDFDTIRQISSTPGSDPELLALMK
jgi:anti-sigma factor RsiW